MIKLDEAKDAWKVALLLLAICALGTAAFMFGVGWFACPYFNPPSPPGFIAR